MYTVIRFVAEPTCASEQLEQVGKLLNEVIAGAFQQLDSVGARFSLSLSAADAWDAHECAIGEFVRRAAQIIASAKSSDIVVEIDTLIEPDDISEKPYFSIAMSLPLLQQLVSAGVSIGVTFCNPSMS